MKENTNLNMRNKSKFLEGNADIKTPKKPLLNHEVLSDSNLQRVTINHNNLDFKSDYNPSFVLSGNKYIILFN